MESDYYHRLYAAWEKQNYLKATFEGIRRYQERNKVKIVVPIFPVIFDFQNYKWRDLNELIIELCGKNDLAYVSLLAPYSRFDDNEMRVQRGDFTHQSVKGNRVAAEAIAGLVLRIFDEKGAALGHQRRVASSQTKP